MAFGARARRGFCYPSHAIVMKILFLIFVLSVAAILAVAGACYLRWRRHQHEASETALREALHEIEQEKQSTLR